MKTQNLIVGQGLAGTLLYHHLTKRGARCMIIDDDHATCASAVAAGLVNPISGRRLILSDDFEKYYAEAEATYREMERTLREHLFEPKDIVRFYDSFTEQKNWSERKDRIKSAPYVKSFQPAGLYRRWFHDPYGSLVIKGHICHLHRLLSSFREQTGPDHIVPGAFDAARLEVTADGVAYRGIQAKRVIFCEGFRVTQNHYFAKLPWKHAKGEILLLEHEGPPLPDKIFNFGKWAYRASDKTVRLGTTFYWRTIDTEPSEEARREILARAETRIVFPYTIKQQYAGVRPVLLDLNPVAGLHPRHPRVGILNGFGAKGVLRGPHAARQLAEYLTEGRPIDRSINISRFNI